jgi:uncharacterized SAM-binding protein YcdF (DUF218 family)
MKSYFLALKSIKLKKFFLSFVAPSFVVLLIVVITHDPILTSYGQWLSPSNPHAMGDIAVSLGSGNRIRTAVKLLASQKVKAIYADGLERERLMEIVAERGLPTSQVYWGGYTKNTFDEALAFKRVMSEANFNYRQVVIVSDNYHLYRSRWAFRQVLGEGIEITTYATPANKVMFDPQWWKHEYSRDWVFSETKKLLFYWIYYGLFGSRSPLSPRDFWK